MKRFINILVAVCILFSCFTNVFAEAVTHIEFSGVSGACGFFSNGINNNRNSIDTVSGGECALIREAGEWLSYDISSLAPGTYDMTAKILSQSIYQAVIGVYVDDVLNISYNTYRTNAVWNAENHTEVNFGKIYVPLGAKILKIKNNGVGANFEISHIKLQKTTDGNTRSKDLRIWASNITAKEDYNDYWQENPQGPAPTVQRTAGTDYYIAESASYNVSGNFRNWDGQNYAVLRLNDFARYSIKGVEAGTYTLKARAGSSVGAKLDFIVDGKVMLESSINGKGNYNTEDITLGKIFIPEGSQYLKVRNNHQAVFIDYFDLVYEGKVNTTTIEKTFAVPTAVNGATQGLTLDAGDYKNGLFYDSAKKGLQSMSGKIVVLYGTEWIKFTSITELPLGTYNITMPSCTQAGRSTEITVKTIDADGNVLEVVTQGVEGTGVNWGTNNVVFRKNIHITDKVAAIVFENGASNYGYGISEVTFKTAYDSYNVTFENENTSVTGSETVIEGMDYNFSVAPNAGAKIYSVSAEVRGNLAQNRNTGEGMSKATAFLEETTDDHARPLIMMAEDNDSPMKDVLRYKHILTDTQGTNVYKYNDISSVMAEKPSAVSFGFWINEEDVNNVFGDTPMGFWPVYQGGAYMSIELPLSLLIANVGENLSITPVASNNLDDIFLTYSISSMCTARDNGWAHIVCNLKGLTYPKEYTGENTTFYMYLNKVKESLQSEGAKIEISNFTYITDEAINSGYIVYPQEKGEKSYKAAVKKVSGEEYIILKEVIGGDVKVKTVAVLAPPEGYEPLMKAKLEGENLYVRTSFDEENDLVQQLIGIYGDGLDSSGEEVNEPVDFTGSGLIPKSQENMTLYSTNLGGSFDQVTPFKFNYSYIGANHGQSDGVVVVASNHGKTYADIGSLWVDEGGVKWNLLKVIDNNRLMFLSENLYADNNKYRFTKNITGTTLLCADSNFAENTGDITIESMTTSVQVRPAVRKQELSVYAVIEGAKQKIIDGETMGCDYVEIVEKYQIMNPALIGKALREARPEGGYTEHQNIAVGEPIVDYEMIYRISADGTVISEFNHTILENINFDWYGGIMHQMRNDAYGGGIHRYIPKTKSFDMVLEGNTLTYNFTEPINITEAIKNNNYIAYGEKYLTSELWENPESMPDRQIDYMFDENSSAKAGYAMGYLPVLDGEPQKRLEKTSSASYLYRSGKAYPMFVNSKAFSESGTKGQKISGVGYKKYVDDLTKNASMYTVPYGRDTYIYIDFHNAGTEEFMLSGILKTGAILKEVEKSGNILYSADGGNITATLEEGNYGYLVICAKAPEIEVSGIEKDIETGKVLVDLKNNSLGNASGDVIVATYKGGALVKVVKENITLGAKQKYAKEFAFEAKSFDMVKAFIWDGFEKITPLSENGSK